MTLTADSEASVYGRNQATGALERWRATDGAGLPPLPGLVGGDEVVAARKPGLTVFGSPTGRIRAVTDAGVVLDDLQTAEGPITLLDVAPAGDRFASGAETGVVVVRSAATGDVLQRIDYGSPGVQFIHFDATGQHLFVGIKWGKVFSVSTPTFDSAKAFADSGTASNLRVCKDSHEVVAVTPYPEGDTVWAAEGGCRGASVGSRVNRSRGFDRSELRDWAYGALEIEASGVEGPAPGLGAPEPG